MGVEASLERYELKMEENWKMEQINKEIEKQQLEKQKVEEDLILGHLGRLYEFAETFRKGKSISMYSIFVTNTLPDLSCCVCWQM
jgi:hypothetical protein